MYSYGSEGLLFIVLIYAIGIAIWWYFMKIIVYKLVYIGTKAYLKAMHDDKRKHEQPPQGD